MIGLLLWTLLSLDSLHKLSGEIGYRQRSLILGNSYRVLQFNFTISAQCCEIMNSGHSLLPNEYGNRSILLISILYICIRARMRSFGFTSLSITMLLHSYPFAYTLITITVNLYLQINSLSIVFFLLHPSYYIRRSTHFILHPYTAL